MVNNIKGNILMVRNMDLGFINIQMGRYMRGNGGMGGKMVRVL